MKIQLSMPLSTCSLDPLRWLWMHPRYLAMVITELVPERRFIPI